MHLLKVTEWLLAALISSAFQLHIDLFAYRAPGAACLQSFLAAVERRALRLRGAVLGYAARRTSRRLRKP